MVEMNKLNRRSFLVFVLELNRRIMMDWTVFLLCLNVINPLTSTKPIWPFIIVPVISIGFPLFVIRFIAGLKIKPALFILSFLICVVQRIAFSWPLWLSICTALFIQWRLHANLRENLLEDDESESKKILSAFILIFVNYAAGMISRVNIGLEPLLLVVFQLFLYTFGSFIRKYFENGPIEKRHVMYVTGLLVIIPVGCASLITAAAFIIRYPFEKIFTFLLSQFLYMIGPLLTILVHFFSPGTNKIFGKKEVLASRSIKKSIVPDKIPVHHYEIIGIICAGIVIGLIILLFIKMRKWQIYDKGSLNTAFFSVTNSPQKDQDDEGVQLDSVYTKSSNQIRKQMRSLEKFARKKGLERKAEENVEEWLNRIGVEWNDDWLRVYEMARYGANGETKIAAAEFSNELRFIYRQMKGKQLEKK